MNKQCFHFRADDVVYCRLDAERLKQHFDAGTGTYRLPVRSLMVIGDALMLYPGIPEPGWAFGEDITLPD